MKFGRKIYSSWRVEFEFIKVHSKMNAKAIQEGSRYFLCMFSCFEKRIEILSPDSQMLGSGDEGHERS